MATAKHAIILYNIELDNCLNGVYAEEVSFHGAIRNEIAIKVGGPAFPDLKGKYNVRYFEAPLDAREAIMSIDVSPLAPKVFLVHWSHTDGTPLFEGRGYLMNPKQIAIHYWAI
jgi:hypothetical protein